MKGLSLYHLRQDLSLPLSRAGQKRTLIDWFEASPLITLMTASGALATASGVRVADRNVRDERGHSG
jgi:hypothetical protein